MKVSLFALILGAHIHAAMAFTSQSILLNPTVYSPTSSSSSSSLQAGIGDDFLDFFKNIWGTNNDNNSNKKKMNNENNNDLSSLSDEVAGSTLITSIPVQSIKPGGLRLFLMFFLMGMQNTPDKGTWKANQPSSEEYIVEMYFRDATAMLSIELLEREIRISRCGSIPSTPYLMQESVVVQGILDELDRCAFDESVPTGSRLLTPEPSNAIELARGSLSFG